MMVYVMRHEEGYLKLGSSNNPTERRKIYQCHYDADMLFERIWHHAKARKVESLAHSKLRPFRAYPNGIRGNEMYEAKLDTVVRAVNESINQLEVA
jgi:hypothetical protein